MTEPSSGNAAEKPFLAELKATATLAWPLVLTNLAQTLLAATDVVMMGWIGADVLAAGALATNLYFAFMIFGMGVITATAPMVARELGRNRHSVRDVRRTVRQGLWTAVIVTLPIWLVLWHTETILHWLGQDPVLSRAAAGYMRTLQWAMLPFLFYLVLRSFLAALEKPRPALFVMAGAIVLNAVLAFGLMFGRFGLPRLELFGAGIATTISSGAMFLGLAAIILRDRRFRRYHVFGRFWRPDWHRLREFWALGLPIGMILLLEVSIFNAAVFLMGLISAASLAAHQIAIQIASLAFMVPMGFGQAATVRVGRAFGAADRLAAERAGWAAFVLGEGFMVLSAATFILAPRLLIGAFLDISDPANAEVVRLAVIFLALAALFQVADGGQALAAGMLRGLHDTRVPMLIAAIGYWGVGLPMSVILGFHFRLEGAGIWLGLAGGLAAVAVLLIARWMRRIRLPLHR